MAEKRRIFSDEEKIAVVCDRLNGMSATEVQQKHDLVSSVVHRWTKEYGKQARALLRSKRANGSNGHAAPASSVGGTAIKVTRQKVKGQNKIDREKRIDEALKALAAGTPQKDVAAQLGVSTNTIWIWKKKRQKNGSPAAQPLPDDSGEEVLVNKQHYDQLVDALQFAKSCLQVARDSRTAEIRAGTIDRPYDDAFSEGQRALNRIEQVFGK